MEADITIIAPDDFEEGRQGAWMQVNSGGRFFPMDPRLGEIKANDIANGLALTCRYGGQGDVNRFYSVAEHSVLMTDYACYDKQPVETQLCCLLHDASEAYAGDVIRSMKLALGESYSKVEDHIQLIILLKYGISNSVWERNRAYVKELDCRIVPLEKRALFGDRAQGWAFDTFEPLKGITIRNWYPQQAKLEFEYWLQCLCRELGMDIEGHEINGY